MNKGITILILVAVLGGMALVFFSHVRNSDNAPGTSSSGGVSNRTGEQPVALLPEGQQGNGTSAVPDAFFLNGSRRAEGVPKAVTVTPGTDGRGVVKSAPTSPLAQGTDSDAPFADQNAAQASRDRGASGSGLDNSTKKSVGGAPGLVPLESPNSSLAKKGDDAQTAGQQGHGQDPASGRPGASASSGAATAKGAHALKNIGLHFSGQNMVLRIHADSAFPCKSFTLTDPDRLVIDLPGTWTGMKAPAVPQNRLVKNVRLGQQPAGPRLVLDLAQPLKSYDIRREGGNAEIELK